MSETVKICLWSGPRNISTALMYSFGNRNDCGISDEPLYGFYLDQTEAKHYHPGADEVMESMECDGEKVVQWMMGDHDKPIMFFKNMAHHLLELNISFMQDTFNLILTRDPKDMIVSFDKVIENPSITDVGYKAQFDLVNRLQENDIQFSVINSKQILKDPENALSEICQKALIPFDSAMLSWIAGPREEDGAWAKYWYSNVHMSTGFKTYKESEKEIPERLQSLYDESMKYYEYLMGYSIF